MKYTNKDFFLKPTLKVAKELLGKTIVFGEKTGIITETEAYVGKDDPACHAARGKTKRNAPMFEEGGISYVYLIYGMYHCLNFVTESAGFPAAVLIRGVYDEKNRIHYDGPGKLCNYFGITTDDSGKSIVKTEIFCILDAGHKLKAKTTPRIGIKKGTDKLWRFVADLNDVKGCISIAP